MQNFCLKKAVCLSCARGMARVRQERAACAEERSVCSAEMKKDVNGSRAFIKICCKTYFFAGIICRYRKSPYLCNVFFMVLDLRLTKVGLSGALFLCPYASYSLQNLQNNDTKNGALRSMSWPWKMATGSIAGLLDALCRQPCQRAGTRDVAPVRVTGFSSSGCGRPPMPPSLSAIARDPG